MSTGVKKRVIVLLQSVFLQGVGEGCIYTTGIIYKLNFPCYDDNVIKRKAEQHRFRKGKRHDYNESILLPL